MHRIFLRVNIALAALVVFVGASFTSQTTAHKVSAAEVPTETQATLVVVASYWKYEAYVGSSYSPHVNLAAEIKNVSGRYYKNIAMQLILRDYAGGQILTRTSAPMKVALAPDESTFISDTISSSSAYQTQTVAFIPFGDPAGVSDYPYLPDPTPLYLDSVVDGGDVTYYGEIVNGSSATWKSECNYCDAVNLTAVYYQGSTIVAYQTEASWAPRHVRPGDKTIFSARFARVPNGTVKLFAKVIPLGIGEYPVSWQVEAFMWSLVDNTIWEWKEITANVRLRNLSDVPARPQVFFVARDTSGKWTGASSCWSLSDIQPGAAYECTDTISPGDMIVGRPEGAQSVNVLFGSSAITHQEYPNTPTPTVTSTPYATQTPTHTPTMATTPTSTPTSTSTPSVKRVYLPVLLRE